MVTTHTTHIYLTLRTLYFNLEVYGEQYFICFATAGIISLNCITRLVIVMVMQYDFCAVGKEMLYRKFCTKYRNFCIKLKIQITASRIQ